MARVFLSYRREEAAYQATSIYEKLCEHFGQTNVFLDVDGIPAGRDFRRIIRTAVQECDVLLVMIGEQWLNTVDEDGRRQLENSTDFVRIEIEAALERDVPVMPLLLGRATMPQSEDLPESVRDLSFRQAVRVRPGRDFKRDTDDLVTEIRRAIATPQQRPGTIVIVQRAGEPLFWQRIAAFALDVAVIYGIVLLLFALLDWRTVDARGLTPEAALALTTLGTLYFVLPTWWVGQTLGKMLLGIEVASADGAPLTFMKSAGRTAAYFLDLMTAFIGFVMAAFGPSYRALHDRLSGTIVVRKGRR